MNDTTNTPARRRKASGARKALIAGVVVVLAGGGWYGWKTYKAKADKEGEYMTAPIEIGNIEDLVTSTGTLQPREFVDVGAQVSGQIEKIFVEVGDVVKKGDVLAEIDATTASAKVDQMRAQLLQAETNLEDSKNSLEKAERDAVRQKNLLEADATTKEAKLNADTALITAKNRIKTQEASIDVQKAQLKIEERNLGYTKIIAPYDGTVMKLSVKQGQTVNASQNVPVVLQIANLTTMTVQAEVSEADVAKLYKGIPVYFTTLGGDNRRWYGELKRIEPTPKVSNAVVLYNALFDVDNDSGALRPQMTAQVYFVSAEARNVLMVPMAAIQQGQQIQRELAQKEREKKGTTGAVAGGPAGGPPGGPPGAMPAGGAPGAGAPGAAAGPAAATPGNAPREGAPAAVAANTAAPAAGSAPAAGAAGQGNRAANAQGGRPGQPGAGGFNGPRPSAGGGRQGGGGFNPENMTPEEREQMIAQFRGGGGGGNFRGGGQRGNFGGRQGGMGNFGGMAAGAPGEGPRPAQRRNGLVMVQKADGTLEARRIVYGVTNRVHAEVLEGLKEGEDVVVAKREKEAAAAARPANALPNNQNFQNNRGGNNFQGGGNFGGGGGRPF
jgi:macrolide-specific efflux system membrane fusion protein